MTNISFVTGMAVSFVAETNFNAMIPFVLAELSGLDRTTIATVMSIQAFSDITGRLCVPLLAHKAGWTSRSLYIISLIGSTIGRTSTYSNVKYSKMRNRPLHGNECTICWVGWFQITVIYVKSVNMNGIQCSESFTNDILSTDFSLYWIVYTPHKFMCTFASCKLGFFPELLVLVDHTYLNSRDTK